MGEYADVKRKDINRLLGWLCRKNNSISVEVGGNHNIILKYSFWKRPFPIPFNHSVVKKHLVKNLSKQLINSKICTKEEFDQHIK